MGTNHIWWHSKHDGRFCPVPVSGSSWTWWGQVNIIWLNKETNLGLGLPSLALLTDNSCCKLSYTVIVSSCTIMTQVISLRTTWKGSSILLLGSAATYCIYGSKLRSRTNQSQFCCTLICDQQHDNTFISTLQT